jgi:hypothetical protein
MSSGHVNITDFSAPPIVKVIARRSLAVGVVFVLVSVVLAFVQPNEFFRAYLLGFMDWLAVALGAMAVLMLRHLTGGGWGMVIRRILGAAMRTIPLMAILFIPLLFGIRRLYIWAQPLENIQNKMQREHLEQITKSYLSVNGFIVRAIIYFAIWGLLSYLLTKWSAEQDRPPVRDNSAKFKAVAGPGLILYGFTISFAAIDWVMSLDPSWTSTIYGLIFLAGQVLAAISFAVVCERILFRYKPMSELLKPDHIHDHGKLMLTFIMVWAYFSFSQWLIIWSGNLPEEITWYVRRLNGGWGFVGLFLVIFQFAVPFAILLSRSFKRDVTRLVWLAVWVLVMRYVDLLWYIEPTFSVTFHITIADIVVPTAIGALWMAYFFRNLGSMPLLPAYDLFAKQVLEPAHES